MPSKAFLSRRGVQSRCASRIRATAPATSGVAKEVPLPRLNVSLPSAPLAAIQFSTPRAQTSGLVRPSKVGPGELNEAIRPRASTAPTATTPKPSAGAMMWPQGSSLSFPAALTTTTPKLTALSAARVVTAVLPSMSAKVYQST